MSSCPDDETICEQCRFLPAAIFIERIRADERAKVEAETVKKIVGFMRRWHWAEDAMNQCADAIERGEWKDWKAR